MSSIVEVKQDIAELQTLLGQATREKVKGILTIEIRKLSTLLTQLEQTTNQSTATIPRVIQPSGPRCYQVKLNNYAWDQTNVFVKLYVTLKNVHTIPAENIGCTFTDRSVELNVKALENKDYILTIKNLLENINPEKSSWKIKTDMVIVSMAKIKSGNWSHITGLEKKASESKVPKFSDDDAKDPSASLMNMMKKMYESGDDEMKRTIAKAWTENNQKGPEMPSF